MLYIGEKLGTLNGPMFDIAVDPLEGTKFTANGEPNAFSVLVIFLTAQTTNAQMSIAYSFGVLGGGLSVSNSSNPIKSSIFGILNRSKSSELDKNPIFDLSLIYNSQN